MVILCSTSMLFNYIIYVKSDFNARMQCGPDNYDG